MVHKSLAKIDYYAKKQLRTKAMSKNNKTKTIIAIATFVIFGLVTWTTLILAGGAVKDTAEDAEKAVAVLKEDGCDPAEEAKARCLVLETNYKHTEKCLDELKTGQTAILEAIQGR